MSENLKAFLAKVSADAQLLERLQAAKEYDDILALAKEIGVELTLADIELPNAEMSEDELNTVTGGGECACVIGGGGTASGNCPACACVVAGYGNDAEGDCRCACPWGGVGAHHSDVWYQ